MGIHVIRFKYPHVQVHCEDEECIWSSVIFPNTEDGRKAARAAHSRHEAAMRHRLEST